MSSSPDPRRWWALAVIAVAQFIVIMDTSIIGVALPHIQRALGFSQPDLSWVFNGYVVAFGGLLLLGGRLGDLVGSRRVFLWGFAVLAAGSLVAGFADNAVVEVAGRAVQGTGAALITPAALSLLIQLFGHDGRELAKAMSLYGAAAPAGGSAGVFLGGVLTQWLDWRWVFLINLPLAMAVFLGGSAVLPRAVRRGGRVDWVGSALVTAALTLAVFAVVRAPSLGWLTPPTLIEIAASVILLALFVAVERIHSEPLVSFTIFRVPNLTAANVVMALLGAAWIPLWFFLNLYLQRVVGLGAFASGAALLPMTVMIMVLMVWVTGRAIARYGLKAPLVTGLLVLAGGLVWLSAAGPRGTYLQGVLGASLVAAVGMSLAYIPAIMSALSRVSPQQAGLASGLISTSYQLGSALGLAIITALAVGAGVGATADQAALSDGFRVAFIGAGGVAIFGALIAVASLRPAAQGSTDQSSDQAAA